MTEHANTDEREAAAREHERLGRLLADSASDFVRLHDLDARTVYNNPATVRLYGTAPGTLFEFAHPDDLDRARDWWERARHGAQDLLLWRTRDRSGTWRWLETRASPVTHRGKAFVVTVCRDVTERQQAAEEHRQHLWFLENLDRVDRMLRGTDDYESMRRSVLDAMLSVFGVDAAFLLTSRDAGTEMSELAMARARHGTAAADADGIVVRPVPGALAVMDLFPEGDGAIAFGAGAGRVLRDLGADFDGQSLLAQVFRPRGDQEYLLGLADASSRTWMEAEKRLFEETGRRLTDALSLLMTVRSLQDSRAKLDEAQRIAHVGYWDNDIQADRITWSDETYRILGLERDVHRPTLRDYVERIHPDDRERQATATAQAWAGEAPYDLEYRIVRPDGTVRMIHSVGEIVRDASGQPRRAFGVVQDITDRRLAEHAVTESHGLLRAVVDGTSDSVYVKDPSGRYLLMNAAGARVHGTSPDQIIGKNDRMLFPPDVARTIMRRDQQVLASGESQTFEETLTLAGVMRTFVTTKGVYRDARGNVAGLIGISSDVTELKRLEAQFRQAQRMEAVGQLAAAVAHDFNNLLTIITAYGSMLVSTLRAGDGPREDVQEILTAAERAAGLTRQLLAFSRKQVLQPRVVDLNEVVGSMAAMLRRLIGEDITLRTELARNVWPVSADPGQLEQVVMNLAVNARDAMPHGGVLRIATANVQVDEEAARRRPGFAPGEYTALTMHDTGTGIAPEILPHLFEPFFTTKGPGKGTGLGLATVYGIVKQSGGYVYAESRPEGGSEFTVYLPRDGGTPEVIAPTTSEAPRGTETILLVEDEAGVRAATRRVLERLGYHVREAATAREALQQVAQAEASGETIDLVLTDVVMPEQSGRVLGERLAAHWPRLRVLYMSGYTDDEIIRRGLAVPGTGFLEKPFTPARLGEAVRRALDQDRPPA